MMSLLLRRPLLLSLLSLGCSACDPQETPPPAPVPQPVPEEPPQASARDLAIERAISFIRAQGYTDQPGTVTEETLVAEMTDAASLEETLLLRQGTLRNDPVCAGGEGELWSVAFAYVGENQDIGRVVVLDGERIHLEHQPIQLGIWCPERLWLWDSAPDLFPFSPIIQTTVDGVFRLDPADRPGGPLALTREEMWRVELAAAEVTAEVPSEDGPIELWRELDAAAMTVGEQALYVVRYHRMRSGGELHALSIEDGSLLWQVPLKAMGPVIHSRYRNRIQLDTSEAGVVVRGWETSGRYVEERGRTDGALISSTVLEAPQPLKPPLAEALHRDLFGIQLSARPYAVVNGQDFLRRHNLPTESSLSTLQDAVSALDDQPLLHHGVIARVSLEPDGNIWARWSLLPVLGVEGIGGSSGPALETNEARALRLAAEFASSRDDLLHDPICAVGLGSQWGVAFAAPDAPADHARLVLIDEDDVQLEETALRLSFWCP